MKIQRLIGLLAVLLGLVVLAFVLASPEPGTAPPNAGQAGPAPSSLGRTTPGETSPGQRINPAQTSAAARATQAGVANPSRLPEIKASQLPPEARQTLQLIARGGPYPYSRDNVPFGNFERVLPQRASGYYREYTVRTPGESDRGARRIVAGDAGEKVLHRRPLRIVQIHRRRQVRLT
ncbi:ribonuclease domain-containing protein [Arthrobacter sp. B3I4]|uniref:ribonuclease domain-containing protein n=1 Tax=Arthrobacter sp. B3I4 TaxID=3042267 RepID=UPI00278031FE|nr:ribonuclease T1 [Arthrobacter sp. B3I4]